MRHQTAGVQFYTTVNLCDTYWNQVTDGSMPSVTLGSTDLYWSTPTPHTLVGGSRVFTTVTLVTASTHTITATGGGYAVGVSSPLVVDANNAARLLVVLPGETLVNGKNSAPYGRSGLPNTQTAGQNFSASVYAIDNWYNLVTTVNQNPINIVTSDPYDTDPGNRPMNNGALAVTCQAHTAQPTTVTAYDGDLSAPALAEHQSSAFAVNPGVPKKLQVLVPGETYVPGSGTGRSGSPSDVQAGASFNATVRSCDDYWNLSYSSPIVRVWTADPNDTNPSWTGQIFGSAAVTITMVTASTGTTTYPVYADDDDAPEPPDFLAHASQGIKVLPGIPVQLLVALPGEEFEGGTPSGKTGTPGVQTAGSLFSVRAAICDSYWNRVLSTPVQIEATSPVDPYDAEPPREDVNPADGTASVMRRHPSPVLLRDQPSATQRD